MAKPDTANGSSSKEPGVTNESSSKETGAGNESSSIKPGVVNESFSKVPVHRAPPYWIVNDKVYDLNKFMHVHPGGHLWFTMNVHRDITNLFHTYHKHPKKLLPILDKYEIKNPDGDAKPIIALPPFLLPPDFDASTDIHKFDFDDETMLLPDFQKELDDPKHKANIKYYTDLWNTLCKVALLVYAVFSLSMVNGWLSPYLVIPAMVCLRTALAGWGHYYIHAKKPNWGDVLFDINYVGTAMTAFDGHVMLHHAYTQTPADVKTSFFFSMLSIPTIWRIPGYTLHKLGNMLFGNLARGLEIQFMERDVGIWHHSFWLMRLLLISEFWACLYTGNFAVWCVQYFISLWFNTFMVLSSHEFEDYGAEQQGKDWGAFQVKTSYDMIIFGNKWIDTLMSAGLSSHRVHHIVPYQTSGFANIYCEKPLAKVMKKHGIEWIKSKIFWIDRLPIILDFVFNSPVIIPNTGKQKHLREPGVVNWVVEQISPRGIFDFVVYVLMGTIGIGAI